MHWRLRSQCQQLSFCIHALTSPLVKLPPPEVGLLYRHGTYTNQINVVLVTKLKIYSQLTFFLDGPHFPAQLSFLFVFLYPIFTFAYISSVGTILPPLKHWSCRLFLLQLSYISFPLNFFTTFPLQMCINPKILLHNIFNIMQYSQWSKC